MVRCLDCKNLYSDRDILKCHDTALAKYEVVKPQADYPCKVFVPLVTDGETKR